MGGTGGSVNAEATRSRATRIGARQLGNPAGVNQVTSVNVQAAVAAQGGILQSLTVISGPPLAGSTCATNMLAVTGSDGSAWVRDGKVLRLDAADPNVGIIGTVVVGACGPGGQGDVHWTYTVPVP